MTCEDRRYGAVISFANVGDDLLARRWIETLGKASDETPAFEHQDIVFQVEPTSEGFQLTPVIDISSPGEKKAVDAFNLQVAGSGEQLTGSDPDCAFDLKKLGVPLAMPGDLPAGYSSVMRTGVGINQTLLLFSDQFGAFMLLASRNSACMYALSPDGEHFHRSTAFGEGFCADGSVTLAGAGKTTWIASDGDATNLQLKETSTYASRVDELPVSIAGWKAASLQQEAEQKRVEDFLKQGGDERSAFSGLDWRINGIPLALDYKAAMADAHPDVSIPAATWKHGGTALRPPIATREELGFVNFGVTDIHGASDRTVVSPTHWHSGMLMHRVERQISSSNPELMPTADSLLATVQAAFGDYPSTDWVVYGQGGLGAQGFEIVQYPVRDGQVGDFPCFRIDTALGAMKTTEEKIEYYRDILAKVETGGYCEGLLAVMYSEGRMGRLRDYKIIARDFAMEAQNELQDIEIRLKFSEDYVEAMPEVKTKL
jgi:hypothetical protein